MRTGDGVDGSEDRSVVVDQAGRVLGAGGFSETTCRRVCCAVLFSRCSLYGGLSYAEDSGSRIKHPLDDSLKTRPILGFWSAAAIGQAQKGHKQLDPQI